MTPRLAIAASNLLTALQQPGVHIEATADQQESVAAAIEGVVMALNEIPDLGSLATTTERLG